MLTNSQECVHSNWRIPFKIDQNFNLVFCFKHCKDTFQLIQTSSCNHMNRVYGMCRMLIDLISRVYCQRNDSHVITWYLHTLTSLKQHQDSNIHCIHCNWRFLLWLHIWVSRHARTHTHTHTFDVQLKWAMIIMRFPFWITLKWRVVVLRRWNHKQENTKMLQNQH